MGDESAAYYRSLFLGQAEKGEQKKRRKASGSGSSSAKKAKKDTPLPPPEDVSKVGDVIATSTKVGDVIATSTEVATLPQPETAGGVLAEVAVPALLSPTTLVDLLGSLADLFAEDLEKR